MDVAKEQELSMAVMNLIATEEHLAFTAAKTGKPEYLELYNAVRKLRSKNLRELVKNKDGEAWCASKHLLSTTMRLIETAIKYGAEGNRKKAMELLDDAIEAYQIFWFLQEFGKKGKK
ncbi:MAG TPA: hypothetical protein HA227_05185 [Candidatus Diapherotrites archaeon]|uniref:Uncharacterized protein n=1 Tax=Candidatus Iainarchaeum sp. TaxID=3101447 RepID=A0A7J4KUC9_9ARCH|nr:hypothetical protein [Candidatus Diapherotrites archaeon]